MASGTADLQRDLGGAIMQSIFGALLTAGFAAAMRTAITAAPDSAPVTSSVESELTKSFSSAADTAERYPQYASRITAAAESSFLDGANWAYAAGIIAVLGSAALVFVMFPTKRDEEALLAGTTPPTSQTSVHGHDGEAGRTVARFVTRFGRCVTLGRSLGSMRSSQRTGSWLGPSGRGSRVSGTWRTACTTPRLGTGGVPT
jgi:hypothetical protein